MKFKDFNYKSVLMNFSYFLSVYILTIMTFLLILNPIIDFSENELVFPLVGKLSFPIFITLLIIFTLILGISFLYFKIKFKLKIPRLLFLGMTVLAVLIPLNAHLTIYYFAPELHLTAFWILNDLLLLFIVMGILIVFITFELQKNEIVN